MLVFAWLKSSLGSKRKKEGKEVRTARISATPAFIFITTTLAERKRGHKKGCCYKSFAKHLKGLFSVIIRIQRHAELGENGEEKNKARMLKERIPKPELRRHIHRLKCYCRSDKTHSSCAEQGESKRETDSYRTFTEQR